MADNVSVTPGVGASVATDDVGGVQYQRVKVTFGVDGVATDVSAANALPITVPGSVAVTGTFYPVTQPISAASLPLPTGAALDATLTGGTQQSKITDGSNIVGVAGSSTAASETTVDRLKVNAALRVLDTGQAAGSQLVAAKGDQTTGLWVNVKNASLPVTGTFWQSTQPVSLATNTPTIAAGSAIIGKVGIDQTTPGTTNLVALAANQSINNAQINGVTPLMGNGVTGTGSQRVTIASDNTAFSVNATLQTGANVVGAVTQSGTWNIGTVTTLPALVAGTALIGKVGVDQTTPGTTNAFSIAQIGANTVLTGNGVTGTGSIRVTIASDTTMPALTAGSALIGKVGIDQTTPGTTNAVSSTPATPTPYALSSANTTNLATVKASAGTLYTVAASNNGAAAAFLKLYNLAVNPTLASSVPVLIVPIPASSVVSVNLGTMGHRFATGIAHAITNLIADTDATAVAAAQVKVILDYI